MKSALDVHRQLLAGDVPHEMVRLPVTVSTADDLPAALGIEPSRCVAVRCYRTTFASGAVGFVAAMVPAGEVPAPSLLLDAVGAVAVRPASADETSAATDYAAGLVCPVALPATLRPLSDVGVEDADVVYTTTGEGRVALGIRAVDLLEAVRARVVRLTPRPEEAAGATGWDLALAPGRAGARVIDLDARRSVG